ncbi:MAG: hypothetical protein R3195_03905 [Gemmatimonadota bacterium]|nr:hypothetical protein [Gemmatimonadota bacterium]
MHADRRPTVIGLAAFAGLFAIAPAVAGQHEEHAGHVSEYAGQEAGEIPSMSAAELEDLRSGAGMGLARAAELNRFPGPKHVLELGDELGLTDDQRAEVTSIHAEMSRGAQAIGARIIEAERELDMRFRHRHIDETELATALDAIAELRGDLRFVHLRAHLRTTRVLSVDQIEAYDELRGYSGPG